MAQLIHFPFLTPPTDEQAMWRVQTRDDPEAFASLVQRWKPAIQRLCIRMLGDAHRAEDVTQEAFARVFLRRKDYQPTAKFSTYLWRVALNLCYDELRRQRRRGELPLEESNDDQPTPGLNLCAVDPTPVDHAVLSDQAEMVRQALLALPEIYRSVVVLRHYEDLKFSEIAAVLDIPEGTVKSRMAEALTLLGRHLAPRIQDRHGPVASATTRPIRGAREDTKRSARTVTTIPSNIVDACLRCLVPVTSVPAAPIFQNL